jgi:prevent-host-death family protein
VRRFVQFDPRTRLLFLASCLQFGLVALKENVVPQLLTIGAYETKTHLADLLRRVRAGRGFTITQRGEPVADLLPAGAGVRRVGVNAALQMQRFMAEAPASAPCDIKAMIEECRD